MFCREEVFRVPSGIPGVYLLHVVDPRRRRYAVVYAGKSADLRDRLVQHLRMRSTSGDVLVARHAADLYFSAAPVLDGELRGAVEAALIASLRPPFNLQFPRPASGLSVTLPPLAISFNW